MKPLLYPADCRYLDTSGAVPVGTVRPLPPAAAAVALGGALDLTTLTRIHAALCPLHVPDARVCVDASAGTAVYRVCLFTKPAVLVEVPR